MRESMRQIFTAKKLEDAQRQAEQVFGVPMSQIVFRILEQKKGFVGIGASVKVEAIYEPETEQPVAAPASTTTPIAEEAEAPVAPVAEQAVAEETATEAVAEETEAEEVVTETVTETVEEETTSAETAAATVSVAPAVAPTEASGKELADLPAEQLAAVERVQNYVTAVYEKLGVTITAEPVVVENGVLLNLKSNNRGGTVIGRRGETLDAMQYLSSIIANKDEEEYCRIILDSNGYREKRRQTLEHLAERLSKNVIRNQRATTLEPMNPYERRIIHAKVAEIDGVGSRSVGEDPYRKVIILPLDENGNPLPSRRGKNHNNNRKDHSENRGEKKNGYRNNHNNNGGNRNNHNRKKRQSEEIPHKPTNFDDIMSTSFEKDYRKPKPEDDLQVGLYGKIE